MNQQIKEKWLAALRSGEYKQTKRVLKGDNGFCCLGVLCDIYSKEMNIPWDISDVSAWLSMTHYLMHDEAEILPIEVQEWAELDSDNPQVFDTDTRVLLVDLNDNGSTFGEIAGLIEESL